jgi:hypothetical protein
MVFKLRPTTLLCPTVSLTRRRRAFFIPARVPHINLLGASDAGRFADQRRAPFQSGGANVRQGEESVPLLLPLLLGVRPFTAKTGVRSSWDTYNMIYPTDVEPGPLNFGACRTFTDWGRA